MDTFDFIPVEVQQLPVGIHLSCEIYYKTAKSGKAEPEYVLLTKNRTLTQELIDRFKRLIFPEYVIYIPVQYLIDELFGKGYFFGYNQSEVEYIRENKKLKPREAPNAQLLDGALEKRAATGISTEESEKFKEALVKYNGTKDTVRGLVTHSFETGKVDEKQSKEVSEDIQNQISTVDPSLILESVNRIRSEDEYLYTHCMHVAYLNGLIGKWLGLDEESQKELVETGLLHDIGKLRVDPEILNKPARLTAEEFEKIKEHPDFSLDMLMNSGITSKTMLDGIVQHHEKVNGTGYPHGLRTQDISMFAKVTAISDIYDAMVTRRVYKEPHSPFVILSQLERDGQSELDFHYVEVFVNCMVEELKGKEMVMNDGSVSKVLLVDPRDLLHPIVEVNGEVIKTNDDLYCVRMKSED
jgi:HD-GYP domain-containing protein (c-di-GMP phosphodiesterase class II)